MNSEEKQIQQFHLFHLQINTIVVIYLVEKKPHKNHPSEVVKKFIVINRAENKLERQK